MIVRKAKGKVILMYNGESNEIESFTLLKLNEDETNKMLSYGAWKLDDGILRTTYNVGDELDLYFKEIAIEHKKSNPGFKEVNRMFKLNVEGTACLIRIPEKHIIKVINRKSNYCTINRTPIDTSTMYHFFNDCKKGHLYNNENIWGLDLRDSISYNKWSSYMNNVYLSVEAESKLKKDPNIIQWFDLLNENILYEQILNIDVDGNLTDFYDDNLILNLVKERKTGDYYLLLNDNLNYYNAIDTFKKWYYNLEDSGSVHFQGNPLTDGVESNSEGVCISGSSINEIAIKLFMILNC